MEPEEIIIVHRISITRSAEPGGLSINSATCRFCKKVIERKEGPLNIKTAGIYGVRYAGTDREEVFNVDEPLASNMRVCTQEMSEAQAEHSSGR